VLACNGIVWLCLVKAWWCLVLDSKGKVSLGLGLAVNCVGIVLWRKV